MKNNMSGGAWAAGPLGSLDPSLYRIELLYSETSGPQSYYISIYTDH